jgi:hypothetical protein
MYTNVKRKFEDASNSSAFPTGLPDGIFSDQINAIWVNFIGPCNARWKYILWTTFCQFYGHLVYFTDIWYILWTSGIFCGNLVFFPVLVNCTKKNLAILFPDSLKKPSSPLSKCLSAFDSFKAILVQILTRTLTFNFWRGFFPPWLGFLSVGMYIHS